MKKKEEVTKPEPAKKVIKNRDIFTVLEALNAIIQSGVKVNAPASIQLGRIARKASAETEIIQTAYPKYIEYIKKSQEARSKLQNPKIGDTNARLQEIDQANQKIFEDVEALKTEYKEAIDEANKVLNSDYEGEPLPTIAISRLTNGEGVPIDLDIQISIALEPILEG